jgi:hypothetical protein
MEGTMERGIAVLLVGWGLFAAAGPAAAAEQDEQTALTALVKTLHDRGVIDEEEYTEISAKAAARSVESEGGWWQRLTFFGDLRGRYEGFWYQHDPDGTKLDSQQRGRYRLRFGARAEVNDHVAAVLQLASNGSENRSANQTLGRSVDFDKDAIGIDLAYLELAPFGREARLPLGSALTIDIGKMPNAFVWKNGKDIVIWDNDINPEGADLRLTAHPADAIELFANTGYFVLDENTSMKDPALFAGQLGARARVSETVTLGGRVGYFHFHALDDDFTERAADSSNGTSSTTGGGNILDGLTGDALGGRMGVFETAFYVRVTCFDDWPITAYGSFSNNIDAQSSVLFPGAGQEDTAWSTGLEFGDKQKYVLLGAMYAHLEANAFPSMLVDSDLFDGRTNRKGWIVYGSRQLFSNTDLNLSAFLSEAIEKRMVFDDSVPGAHRLRLQADLLVKF